MLRITRDRATKPATEGAVEERRSPASVTAPPASGAERVSRREALKTYVPPAIAVIGLPTAASLAGSGPVSRTRKGNNGFGQERQGAPKDGPPAGKPKNDKPGPR